MNRCTSSTRSQSVLALFVILLAASSAFAQPPIPGAGGRGGAGGGGGGGAVPGVVEPDAEGRIQIVAVEYKGVIDQVLPTAFRFHDARGAYTADLAHRGINIPPAKITFDRDETQRFLDTGMIVRFEADMDKTKITNKVKNIEVIGMLNAGAGIVNTELLPTLGVSPIHDLDADALLDDALTPRKDGERGSYVVVARVKKRVSHGYLQLEIPDLDRPGEAESLRAQLSEDAVVKLADIRFAQPGNHVHVKGEDPRRDLSQWFWATEVSVTSGDGEDGKKPKSDDAVAATNPPKTITDTAVSKKKDKYRGTILKIN